jgi:hypothetical protein
LTLQERGNIVLQLDNFARDSFSRAWTDEASTDRGDEDDRAENRNVA